MSQAMLSSHEGEENDVFFDSLDRLSADETSAPAIAVRHEIWANEPRSVEERRRDFLRQMGFSAEFGEPEAENSSPEEMGLDGVECSLEESLDCCRTGQLLEEQANLAMSSEKLSNVSRELEECPVEERRDLRAGAMGSWWKRFSRAKKARKKTTVNGETPREGRVKVCRKNKRFSELTAGFIGQEFRAHEGLVWTAKFSPDGRYLASGGEDGVVRVWRVMTVEASLNSMTEVNLCSKLKAGKLGFRRKHPVHASVVLPDKLFQIDESPINEFHGHSGDVLDLAWSHSNHILSSSTDKTVRLWQLGRDESIYVFHHNDYVTCIDFNPVDGNYFISGSIDGKVRIWGLSEKRVVDWTDARDVVTAICYQPDGKGFIVGTIAGSCRSYRTSGECMVLETKIKISGRKKTSGNKITGIKFSHNKPQRVMISSEDSKIRIFDGVDLSHKYKALAKSGSQTSASFTSTESHIVSVDDDSRVYVWNYDPSSVIPSKSVQSCEYFSHQGVSVAVPWPGSNSSSNNNNNGTFWTRDSERFSLGSCLSGDSPFSKGSATWPEEKLPLSVSEEDRNRNRPVSETWGLVIVTAGSDGTIRTFHNYGMPIRL